MPAKSQAQRAYLNAHFGHAWTKEHHFDNKGKLPGHVGDKKKRKAKRPSGDPHASAQHKAMNKKHGCGIAGYC